MNAIGGYFGLELPQGREYHPEAAALNTGRNALEFILLGRQYRKIYLPYFTCHVLLQPVERLGIEYAFYAVDEQLEPLFDYSVMEADACFLYTNYFGLKDDYVASLKGQVANLIIDNAQAFFSMPLPGVDAFYSPRKFFGVPDGGYAYTSGRPDLIPEQDFSYERCAHLLIRADDTAEKGYPEFLKNDESLDHNPIRAMSRLTQKILKSIDYRAHKEIRRSNFEYLQNALAGRNRLALQPGSGSVPMVYPYLGQEGDLRRRLIGARVYVAQYWPEVLQLATPDSLEYRYATHVVPLPVDQRLTTADLDHIISIIKS